MPLTSGWLVLGAWFEAPLTRGGVSRARPLASRRSFLVQTRSLCVSPSGVARREMVLTLPLVVYVDDAGIIGEDRVKSDEEMLRLQDWSWQTCGVPWKRPKDRAAAIPQYYIGHNIYPSM